MLDMARSTDVVVSCAGPYGRYGEASVKACVEGGAHYVDITGEYGAAAERAGVTLFVLGALGKPIAKRLTRGGGYIYYSNAAGPVDRIHHVNTKLLRDDHVDDRRCRSAVLSLPSSSSSSSSSTSAGAMRRGVGPSGTRTRRMSSSEEEDAGGASSTRRTTTTSSSSTTTSTAAETARRSDRRRVHPHLRMGGSSSSSSSYGPDCLVHGVVPFRSTTASSHECRAPPPAAAAATAARHEGVDKIMAINRRERARIFARILPLLLRVPVPSPARERRRPPHVRDDSRCARLQKALYLLGTYYNLFVIVDVSSPSSRADEASSSSLSGAFVGRVRSELLNEDRGPDETTTTTGATPQARRRVLPRHRIAFSNTSRGRVAFVRQLHGTELVMVIDRQWRRLYYGGRGSHITQNFPRSAHSCNVRSYLRRNY
ncbi:hypothetical protein ACHAW5_000580 [Stephanodiscus triporus]|uniref:Saccharopine dehydrogenase NADP binding domain-containing protein n=1 Tax=Stephanodiscus triporus TaxID=2934178 RepID=A0ABD3ND69_9STRA